jgi:cytochrome c-type biogenesis protein CcmE
MVDLVASGMRGATVYSLTVGELKDRGPAAAGQGVRVSGILDGDTVFFDSQALLLTFTLRDGDQALPVLYQGVKPDNMKDDAEVIVEGKLRADGALEAKTLLFKCPSKYEAADPTTAAPQGPSQ